MSKLGAAIFGALGGLIVSPFVIYFMESLLTHEWMRAGVGGLAGGLFGAIMGSMGGDSNQQASGGRGGSVVGFIAGGLAGAFAALQFNHILAWMESTMNFIDL